MDNERDINDPSFFDNDNLSTLEEDASVDPFTAGWGGLGGDDDGADGAVPVADEGDGSGDEAGVPPEVEPEPVDDPAPHLKDLDTAKKSWADTRKWGNTLKAENDALNARLAAMEQGGDDEYDEYDGDHYQQLAGQNPVHAFNYALEQGATADASSSIAQVQSDATDLAAQATNARQDGDEATAQHYTQLARNAGSMAEQMRQALADQNQQARMAPLEQQQQINALQAAAATVRARHSADIEQYAGRIGEIVQNGEVSFGDGSPASLERGFQSAYNMARGEAGGMPANIDELVAAKVSEALEGKNQGRRTAAAAAQGEGVGRRDLSSTAPMSDEDKAREGMGLGAAGRPIGHSAVWNLNHK